MEKLAYDSTVWLPSPSVASGGSFAVTCTSSPVAECASVIREKYFGRFSTRDRKSKSSSGVASIVALRWYSGMVLSSIGPVRHWCEVPTARPLTCDLASADAIRHPQLHRVLER